MKIIQTDNFGRDDVSEILVAENVKPNYAQIIVDLLNDNLSGKDSQVFFKVENDDYELYNFVVYKKR